MKKIDEIKDYAKHYTDKDFLEKILHYAKAAGINVIYVGLLLFYTLQNPSLPKKLKGLVMGSLGYFILPIDLIPDFIPMAGYTDDLAVLLAAMGVVAMYIDDESKEKSKSKLKDLFGDYDEDLLKGINDKINKRKKEKKEKRKAKDEL